MQCGDSFIQSLQRILLSCCCDWMKQSFFYGSRLHNNFLTKYVLCMQEQTGKQVKAHDSNLQCYGGGVFPRWCVAREVLQLLKIVFAGPR